MIDVLECADGHEWVRERKRGYLPARCPEHAEQHRKARHRETSLALHHAKYQPITGQPITLQCIAGHAWEWPRKKGFRPKACPDHREILVERDLERNRKYRRENPEKARTASRAWAEANADRVRAYSRSRRARKAGASTVEAKLTWRKVADRDGMECSYCPVVCDPKDGYYKLDKNGRKHWVCGKAYPTLDHIVPLLRGGDHVMENAVLACYSCNSSKGVLEV